DEPLTDAEEAPAASAAPDAALADLQRERDDYYDRLLPKSAEFDNYRKGGERERREQGDQAVTDLLQELLSIVDDFDRALTVDAGENGAAYRKGVGVVQGQGHALVDK